MIKSEDDYLNEIFFLAEKIKGLTYGAQGFDANGDLVTGEEWRDERDDVLEDLIAVSQGLRDARPMNSGEDSVQ